MDRIGASRQAPKPAVVIHLGACSATTESDADYLLENNYRLHADASGVVAGQRDAVCLRLQRRDVR